MSNSSLVTCTKLSPNCSKPRANKIERITPHCVVGQLDAMDVANMFADPAREASSNYIIGTKGDVCLCVDEANRSWCSSSRDNDNRAVTIECASDKTSPYAFNTTVYNKLIDLCVDICKRNGKTKLLFLGTKEKSLSYTVKPDELILTAHRWFANTDCPGDWMMNHMSDLAEKVTDILNPKPASNVMYRVQVGAYSIKDNAINQYNAVKKKGFDAILVKVNNMYKVQVGAYSVKSNADAMLNKIKAAGFSAIITTEVGTQVSVESTTKSETTQVVPLHIEQSIKSVQKFLNTYYSASLDVDGKFGKLSKAALAKAFQIELNKLGAGIAVDGSFGSASQKAFETKVGSLKKYSKGIFVTLWQCLLVGLGYDPRGIDGNAGGGFVSATNLCLKANGLTADSEVNGSDINKLL